MQGMNIAECCHVVNVLPPVDLSGGATGDRFSMANWGHASVIVSLGITSVAPTAILVKECNAASGGTATAIAFSYYKQETADGDVLSTKQSATASGFAPSANNNIFYVIELDARQLSDGYEWVEVSATCESGQSVLGSIVAVLSGGRYQGVASPTVLS
ncbi:MAG TPA: hypothetical protein VD860_16930 [Azospirillum sp.]|nr:hypothetical protein [Azospirillum sp.]